MKLKHILIFLLFSLNIFAQNENQNSHFQCFTKEEMKEFTAKTIAAKRAYYAEHKISEANLRKAANHHVLFRWPLQSSADYDFQYNNSTITNFVDQDVTDNNVDDNVRNPDFIEDWNCGKRTYDGHRAEDIALFPFSWYLMEKQSAMVVAAAAGTILDKGDGNYDKNCQWAGAGNSNFVNILHDDGTVSSYRHLKENSVTTKANNSRVEEGEYLGFVGSSGRSTGPHLHFEVTDINDDLIDPFVGSCNILNNDTWWKDQRSYWEPQINRIMTHSASPIQGSCWNDTGDFTAQVVSADNYFSSGAIFWTSVAFQDVQPFDLAECSLIQPNGAEYSTWQHSFSVADNSTLKIGFHQLPSGNTGTWIVKVVYRSKNYYHFFTVGCNSSESVSGSVIGSKGYISSTNITSEVVHSTNSMSKVLYQAGTEITFSPGFEIKSGAHLKARIKGCSFVE
ncbi:MAG: M23 family metallopeptidase [Bacteroidota bacterium]